MNSKKERETPMMEQYNSIKRNYPNAILFFRMGDFYEMFLDDAIKASKVLNIALTTRDKNKVDPIPMCGVPYHAMETYLAKLIRAGLSVAVCDQVEDPRQAKGIVKREVTRVITPGTLLDPGLMDEALKNFLCAVYFKSDGDNMPSAGLAFLELSTAEFFVMEFEDEYTADHLADELVRLRPKEVLLPKSLSEKDRWKEIVISVSDFKLNLLDDWYFSDEYSSEVLLEHFQTVTLEGFGLAEHQLAKRAAGALIYYLRETQKRPLTLINNISFLDTSQFMVLDRICQRNLELTERLIDNSKNGTLLNLLDETVTPMGARELRNWVLRPLIDIDEITARQNTIEKCLQSNTDVTKIRRFFAKLTDLNRIISRISLKVAHPRDVAALRDSLALLPVLEPFITELQTGRIEALRKKWDNLDELFLLLKEAMKDTPASNLRDGGVIRTGYNKELDEVRLLRKNATALIKTMEEKERKRAKLPKLKIKYNKVFGYFIEITKAQSQNVPENYIRKQTLVNSERFYTPELKEFEEKVLSAEEKMIEIENRLFEELRKNITAYDNRVLQMAAIIAEIDILLTLSVIAAKYNYKRPLICEEPIIKIEKGRHPVMEVFGTVDRFIPNETFLDQKECHLLIITGPNMAGKSTYIRQVALLTIMAQMGSFIPAKEAKIGIVDRIFTRVGAADNLIEGQSTFMVEMIETATILNNATNRSLLILDEIGRGTSTFDGLALAWAIAEYVSKNEILRARTLFATHLHQLTELSELIDGVQNFHVAVKEWNERIIFMHKLIKGGTDKSYGIQVARLAGVPQIVIKRAAEILTNLELTELTPAKLPFGIRFGNSLKSPKKHDDKQLSLFENLLPQPNPVLEELKKVDLKNLTPLQALNLLADFQKKI